MVGWLCTVAWYNSVVITNEEVGNNVYAFPSLQSSSQLIKDKSRVGHTTPGT